MRTEHLYPPSYAQIKPETSLIAASLANEGKYIPEFSIILHTRCASWLLRHHLFPHMMQTNYGLNVHSIILSNPAIRDVRSPEAAKIEPSLSHRKIASGFPEMAHVCSTDILSGCVNCERLSSHMPQLWPPLIWRLELQIWKLHLCNTCTCTMKKFGDHIVTSPS